MSNLTADQIAQTFSERQTVAADDMGRYVFSLTAKQASWLFDVAHREMRSAGIDVRPDRSGRYSISGTFANNGWTAISQKHGSAMLIVRPIETNIAPDKHPIRAEFETLTGSGRERFATLAARHNMDLDVIIDICTA